MNDQDIPRIGTISLAVANSFAQNDNVWKSLWLMASPGKREYTDAYVQTYLDFPDLTVEAWHNTTIEKLLDLGWVCDPASGVDYMTRRAPTLRPYNELGQRQKSVSALFLCAIQGLVQELPVEAATSAATTEEEATKEETAG